jgi:hypothetical protein
MRVRACHVHQVGPTIFLGSGILFMDIKKALPQYPHGAEKAVLDALDPFITATNNLLIGSDNAIRVLRNTSNWTNINFPPVRTLGCSVGPYTLRTCDTVS